MLPEQNEGDMYTTKIALFGLLLTIQNNSAQISHIVSDPYKTEHFSCRGNPDGRLFNYPSAKLGYNGFRIIADLNFDGHEDLILTTSDDFSGGYGGCGNASCGAAIFLKQPNNTYVRSDFELHPDAVAVKMVRRGEGQLVTYYHGSAKQGALCFYKVASNSVTLAKNQTLYLTDNSDDMAIYRYWFNGALALKAEYAWCTSGLVEWNESYR